MNKKNSLKTVSSKFFDAFLNFLYFQLFLTLISWPILIAWGLPLSVMSPIGNFIFGPIMMTFLFLSSLVFFTEFFCIPNCFLILLLEYVTRIWCYFLKFGSSSWFICLPCSSHGILILFPIFVLVVLQYAPWCRVYKKIFSFFILSTLLVAGLLISAQRSPRMLEITGARKTKMTCYFEQKYALIVGAIGLQKNNVDNWINYTLLPQLIKIAGSMWIDFFIIMQPAKTVFMLCTHLCEKQLIKHIYLKKWRKKIDRETYSFYKKMCCAAHEHGISITYFSPESALSLDLGKKTYLKIEKSNVRYITNSEA